MEDQKVIDRINALAHEEHDLFEREARGEVTDAERLEGGVDLGPPAGGGDAPRDTRLGEVAEQVDRPGERTALRLQLPEQRPVPALDRLDLVVVEGPAHLPGHAPSEQPATHPDLAVDPPSLDGQPCLPQRPVPGEHVRVHGVDQRAVEVEDQAAHRAVSSPRSSARRRGCSPRGP